MSNLAMTQSEEKSIDSKVEQMMDWAQSRQIEAEQLALDSARLMACTTDRLDRLSKQGFYKRCWSRFNGDANAMERANVNDVIQMQKMAFRYVNMLQEQQLLMAHSLLSLKNNLNSLAVREEETRNLIALLAQRTLERFEQLEGRVGKLETSSNLHDWLFTLEERDYEEKIPTDYMRLLRIINDFYEIKNDNWNNNDLMFMRKAIRTVGLNPKEKVSINTLINKLADEIQSNQVGFDTYDKAITLFAPDGMSNYSQFAIDNVSSPVFATLHGLNTHYRDKMDAVEALQDSLSISTSEALKTLLRNGIKSMNVNLDYEFPLAETAIEILGCLRLSNYIYQSQSTDDKTSEPAREYGESGSIDSIDTRVENNISSQSNTYKHVEEKLDALKQKIDEFRDKIDKHEEELENIYQHASKIYEECESRSNGGLFGKALAMLNKDAVVAQKKEITARIVKYRKDIHVIYKEYENYLYELYNVLLKNGFQPARINTICLEWAPNINIDAENFDWLYTEVDNAIEESKLSNQLIDVYTQYYDLRVKLEEKKSSNVEVSEDTKDSFGELPVQIIDGVRALDRFIDVMKILSTNDAPLDRMATYFNTPDRGIGSLPNNFQQIINRFEKSIDSQLIVYLISDGNLGAFVSKTQYSDIGYICTYDLSKNIYSVVDGETLERLSGTEAEMQIVKKYGLFPKDIIMDAVEPLQEKLIKCFPEIEQMMH